MSAPDEGTPHITAMIARLDEAIDAGENAVAAEEADPAFLTRYVYYIRGLRAALVELETL